ncbi:FAD-binding oxidoreductase [Herbaspirillum lusitanum]|uniref:FAD-binding oxidoreductase n=1 Tax=Herbaspirillum lusitanum TaxID=213312 RepID=A0ABW9AEN0_9BURK
MANSKQLLADNFNTNPYWWDAAPPETALDDLPGKVDVVVVGSGYCGLTAAAEMAGGGASVAVLDAQELGIGGSTRSGGMVSSGQKLVVSNAISGVSPDRLERLLRESLASFDYLKELVQTESLDADLHISGRFFGAYTPAHFERLRGQGQLLREKTGVTVHEIQRKDQHAVIGSDYYHGGIVVDEYGGLHTAKYHRSLRDLARRRGAGLFSHAPVDRIERAGSGFRVVTGRGSISAAHVVLATNGYTGGVVPYLQKRVVPVASYQIATAPLPAGLMTRLIPGRRMISDSKRNLFYIRPSPDGTRILFGSRPTINDIPEREAAGLLHRKLVEVWPELQDVQITNCWKGYVAMTWDKIAHIGEQDGLHYAVGCNGNGVALMTYLGSRIARKVLAKADAACAFDEGSFPGSPLGGAQSWVVPFGAALYRIGDRFDALGRRN